MGIPLKKEENKENKKRFSKTSREKAENTFTDELIIGICSPIGSSKKVVIESVSNRLKEYGYEVREIKLSNFINEYYDVKYQDVRGKTPEYSKLMHKINGGNSLRDKYNNSILVELAIKQIRLEREIKEPKEANTRRVCYIINSLKNLEELKLLRTIYKDIFYLFSVFSPENERIDNLFNKGLNKTEAKNIIETDQYENILNGQNVRDTFIEADFFVRVSKKTIDINEKIKRYFHLIFESNIITPNNHETAMYHAQSAAGNSACLSRQVGATITDKNGVTIARGWNDVPKFGGNLYRDNDIHKRCKDVGYCSNERHKNDIFFDIEKKIAGILDVKNKKINDIKRKENEKIFKQIISEIKSSKFKNIIEYSRSIHAEMHAIIIGSQMTGDRMVGGSLYCTTYPCHNCARHIVLSGIKKVYYIEPYKKSLGLVLHNDAITEDEEEGNKVKIIPYDGVAPRRYLEFFSMTKNSRKDNTGNVMKNDLLKATPKKRVSLQALPTLESQTLIFLKEIGLITDEENKKLKL